jgi:hypothetical protein
MGADRAEWQLERNLMWQSKISLTFGLPGHKLNAGAMEE